VRALLRSGDAEVLKAFTDERERLVSPLLWFDAKPSAFDQFEQPLGVAREAKKPVAFSDPLWWAAVLRAQRVGEFAGGEERLAASAVQPLVVALVEIFAIGACAPQALDARAVARVAARADEVVDRQLERFAKRGKPLRLRRYEIRDRQAGSGRRLDVLERVLVSPTQEADALTAQPPDDGRASRTPRALGGADATR
jgi:hypothetical protein